MHYELNVAVFVRILCALKKDEPMQASQGYVLPEIASQPDFSTWQHGPLRRELDARGLPGDRKDQSLNDISQVHARYMASLLEVNARALMLDWSSPADTAIYAVKRTSTESSAAGYSPALTGPPVRSATTCSRSRPAGGPRGLPWKNPSGAGRWVFEAVLCSATPSRRRSSSR